MNFSKIRLNNERNEHVTKRLNRLSTWKFFTVLYRENIWRLFGFSLLMLLCIAPIFVVMILGSFQASSIQQGLPLLNNLGFSTGAWEGMEDYIAEVVRANNSFYALMSAVAALAVTVVLSGGFAVVRDAFWTGRLSTVGVFRSIGKGIKANIAYAFVSTIVIAFSVYGLYELYTYMAIVLPLWAAIVILVLLAIADMFVVMYLLILCSVTVTYKQSVYENMDDAWRLMWLNVLPNILHLIIALIPIPLYFVFGNGMLQSIYLVLVLMFGGMYFPLVWHSHMMRTFALFHPVEAKKKSQVKREEQEKQAALAQARREKVKNAPKAGGAKAVAGKVAIDTPAIVEKEGEGDPYALDEDAYDTDEILPFEIASAEENDDPAAGDAYAADDTDDAKPNDKE